MRNLIYWTIALVCAIAWSGCTTRQTQYGFDDKVKFTAEGGTFELVSAEQVPYFINMSILDGCESKGYDDHFLDGETRNLKVSYDWLTVEHQQLSNRIKFTADKNTTGKKRRLKVELEVGTPHFTEIVVEQAPK